MASGEWIGSFALTEPQCGLRRGRAADHAPSASGDSYVLNGAQDLHHQRAARRTTSSPSRAPSAGISAFIVDADAPGRADRPGVRHHRPPRLADLRGRVRGLRASPPTALIGEEGKGFDYAKRCLVGGPHDAQRALRRRGAEGDGAGARVRRAAQDLRQAAGRAPGARLPPGADERPHRGGAPGGLPLGLDPRPGRPGDPRVVDRQATRRRGRLADGRRRACRSSAATATSAAST